MYRKSNFKVYDVREGVCIEREIEKSLETGQPLEATAPLIFTPRKDGVNPSHDIRTDRFDLALDAMEKYNEDMSNKVKTDNKPEEPTETKKEQIPEGEKTE